MSGQIMIRGLAIVLITKIIIIPTNTLAEETKIIGNVVDGKVEPSVDIISPSSSASPSLTVEKSIVYPIREIISMDEATEEGITEQIGSGNSELENGKTNEHEDTISSSKFLTQFDQDKDDRLNFDEFGALCEYIFKNGSQSYKLENETLINLFNIFDWSSNGFICKDEFEICYERWILKIIHPISVLVIVDVQNDFISGTLALKNAPAGQDGKDVVEPINEMLDDIPFKYVFYTKDWHPANHISFIDNVQLYKLHNSSEIQDPTLAKVYDTVIFEGDNGQPIVQNLWPAHCVQETWGSELDKDLKVTKNSKIVYKGMEPGVDSYSAFLDNEKNAASPLKEYIENVGALDVYISGLALDVCVGFTSLDGLDLGFRTVVVEDATRSINLESVTDIKRRVMEKNGVLVNMDEVTNMVLGINRRPELGVQLAMTLQKRKLEAIGQTHGNGNIIPASGN